MKYLLYQNFINFQEIDYANFINLVKINNNFNYIIIQNCNKINNLVFDLKKLDYTFKNKARIIDNLPSVFKHDIIFVKEGEVDEIIEIDFIDFEIYNYDTTNILCMKIKDISSSSDSFIILVSCCLSDDTMTQRKQLIFINSYFGTCKYKIIIGCDSKIKKWQLDKTIKLPSNFQNAWNEYGKKTNYSINHAGDQCDILLLKNIEEVELFDTVTLNNEKYINKGIIFNFSTAGAQ
jgi:hypothetical protein